MNANNNNQTPCANAFADNAPNCVGIVAVGNEHGLCSACELKRRQDALDDIFARHNMSASASTDDVIDHCEKCHQDIHVGERTYTQRIHTVRMEDGEPMVEDLLVCSDCHRGYAVGRVIRRTAGGRVRTMPAHRGVDCTVCGLTIYDGTGTVCSGCVGEGFTAIHIECERCGQIKPRISDDPTYRVCGDCESNACQAVAITATVVQPAVEAVAVQAVTLTAPPQHDDCCCCLGNDATAWTKMACGHEVCSDCHTSLRNSDVTSVISQDSLILGWGGAGAVLERDVICPLCRAQNASNDPVELHLRLAKYRQKLTDVTERSRKMVDLARKMVRDECDVEHKRLREIIAGNSATQSKVIEDLKRQLAEARALQRPAKTCDGCSKPQEDDRVPYCNGCMTTLYGENWARDNGLMPPAQKHGGGGGGARAEVEETPEAKAEARGEPRVVRQMYKPDTTVARAVLVGGGGGGGAPTPRRPCHNPDCETPKPTQRRCSGDGCRRNHRDIPCCKRCVLCPACR